MEVPVQFKLRLAWKTLNFFSKHPQLQASKTKKQLVSATENKLAELYVQKSLPIQPIPVRKSDLLINHLISLLSFRSHLVRTSIATAMLIAKSTPSLQVSSLILAPASLPLNSLLLIPTHVNNVILVPTLVDSVQVSLVYLWVSEPVVKPDNKVPESHQSISNLSIFKHVFSNINLDISNYQAKDQLFS